MSFPRQTVLPSIKSSPEHPELHLTKQTLDSVFEESYWRKICPELHVNDKQYQEESLKYVLPVPDNKKNEWTDRIKKEGYFDLHSSECKTNMSMDILANNVVKLMQYGWPPSFLVMFDEIWALVYKMSEMMFETTGNRMNMDILIWFIDPNQNQSGFSPHRDRQPDDAEKTFRKDGTPMYSTCWN